MADADDCPSCAAGHEAHPQVLISLIRRVMPNQLAKDILSVQPMTTQMWPELAWDCGLKFEHDVSFPSKHPVFNKKDEVRMWAIDNMRGLYAYRSVVRQSISFLSIQDWVWSFQDPNDAVLFKVRWL